jgi:hypothetical protein
MKEMYTKRFGYGAAVLSVVLSALVVAPGASAATERGGPSTGLAGVVLSAHGTDRVYNAARVLALPGAQAVVISSVSRTSTSGSMTPYDFRPSLEVIAQIVGVYDNSQFICAYGTGSAIATPETGSVSEKGSYSADGYQVGTTNTSGQGSTTGETECIYWAKGAKLVMSVFGTGNWTYEGQQYTINGGAQATATQPG